MGQSKILEDNAVEDSKEAEADKEVAGGAAEDSKEAEADKEGAGGAAVDSEVDWLDVFLLDITIFIWYASMFAYVLQ